MNLTGVTYFQSFLEKEKEMLSLRVKLFRWIELVALYIGVPLVVWFKIMPAFKLVPLFIVFIVYLFLLVKDKSFKNRQFRLNGFNAWSMIFYRTAIMAVFLVAFTWYFYPEQYFDLLINNFNLWLRIVLVYPFFSVIPQELVFRVYFYHRFKGLISGKYILILLNALLFSFTHIVFENWVVLIFTFIASILFSFTYLRHRSLVIVSLEHSLYGLLIFTLGPGSFFHTY